MLAISFLLGKFLHTDLRIYKTKDLYEDDQLKLKLKLQKSFAIQKQTRPRQSVPNSWS